MQACDGSIMKVTEITNLIYYCAELLDNGEVNLAADLFSDARVRFAPESKFLNNQELLEHWLEEYPLKQDGTPGTHHFVTNPIVRIDETSGTATCRSNFMVIRRNSGPTPVVSERGVYRDTFMLTNRGWKFTEREYQLVGSPNQTFETEGEKGKTSIPTKAKILIAAQEVFSTLGYAEASIRKIAEHAGLSPALLFRHFGTKANLFEEALIAVMDVDPAPEDKRQFGQHVADLLADPNQLNCPHAMTILATGSEEAREIAVRVLKKYAIDRVVGWIEGPNAESRAREIMALCAGFALYNSQLNFSSPKQADPHMIEWFAKGLQAIVDQE